MDNRTKVQGGEVMEYVFFILLGVAIFVFGYVMGLVCASKKRRNEPCVTMQDIIDREG